MMEKTYEIELAGEPLIIATGRYAQQAGGAVTVRYGDTLVLGTATASKPRPGIDFFPLSVEFEERLYAAGRIPGSFFRREGRPTTTGVLSARLTDRPLRPLFPKGYMDDTQVIITVLSADMEHPPDTLGTIAASAALTISDIPFDGPVASVRLGHVNGSLVLQPKFEELNESDLNIVVAGTKDAIMMVEADAAEVSEALLVEALELGQEAIASIVAVQEQLREDFGKPKRSYEAPAVDEEAVAAIERQVGAELTTALSSAGIAKAEREARIAALKAQALDGVADEDQERQAAAFGDLEGRIVRSNILERGLRPDGRTPTQIRELSSEVGLIPRTHGSGLFQRGETQVLALTTLAGTGMAQRLDDLTPVESKRFMHHYNFPPFSTGETGRVGTPSRRSIGHGMLGERAMMAVLPDFDEFPYTIRIVSEVLSSNGSTSQASVCAAVLSMMDAGVPLKAPVAGVAMGLIKGEQADEFSVLTDIAGIEDHLGDMDFKVAGTRAGVTALQMDIKVQGITTAIMAQALDQARAARLEVIESMAATIAAPRDEMSPYAPRVHRLNVPQEKIGVIIGPGGKTIRSLEEQTGASIDIESDGAVFVSAPNGESLRKATEIINAMTKEVEPGEVYTGKVTRLMNFGAFVEVLPGKDALVHISELADYRVPSVEDVVKVGDELTVKITEIDNLGRINASRRALLTGEDAASGRDQPADRDERDGGADGDERGDGDDRPGRGPRPRRGRAGRGFRDRPPARERGFDGDGPSRERAFRSDDAPEEARPDSGSEEFERRERQPVESAANDAEAPAGVGRRRRRRRRRRSGGDAGSPSGDGGAAAQERQPDTTASGRPLSRVISRLGARRAHRESSDGDLGPPPPPRPDFGAPQS
ncbi:MAG: polyribonucleotide nucleotidyltransferase [Chloroflexi bacterium]|nr:polyribonucleotide nucleotidyltransferase [Chloroflexota bacterium]